MKLVLIFKNCVEKGISDQFQLEVFKIKTIESEEIPFPMWSQKIPHFAGAEINWQMMVHNVAFNSNELCNRPIAIEITFLDRFLNY